MNKLYKFLSSCVYVLAGMIILWFFIMSICSSSIIIIDERTLYIGDKVWMSVLLILLLLIVGALLYKNNTVFKGKIENIINRVGYRHIRNALIIISVIMCVVFVLITGMYPADDQAKVINAVELIKNRDFSDWSIGGYFDRCPHQNPLVLVLLLISFIFPKHYVLVFQLLSCVAIGGIAYYIDLIMDNEGVRQSSRLAVQIAYLVFIPLKMYTTFVYGTILGLFFSTAAIYYCVKYLKFEHKKDIVLTGIYCAIASLLKSNYVIFLIAIIISVVLHSIKSKKYHYVIGIMVMVGTYLVASRLSSATISTITGQPEGKGMSSLSYVAMGLHDNVYRGPGWKDDTHNERYTAVLSGEGDEVNLALEDIKESIGNFRSGDRDLIDFIGRKEASIWANPSFQGQWVNARNDYSRHTGRVAEWILSLRTIILVYPIIDLFLVMIYFGNIAHITYSTLSQRYAEGSVLTYTVFLGGTIFHTIWEAKAQYTLPYFVILIPYGVYGICELIKLLESLNKGAIMSSITKYRNWNGVTTTAKLIIAIGAVCGILILGMAWKGRGIIRKLVCVNYSQGEYERYENYFLDDEQSIEEGIYELKGANEENIKLLDEKAFTTPVIAVAGSSEKDNREGIIVSVENTNGKSMIKICASEKRDTNGLYGFVVVDSLDGGMYTEVSALPYCGVHDFEIIPVEDMRDTYYIKSIDNYAMTLSDDGKVTMEILENKDSQKWTLLRKK